MEIFKFLNENLINLGYVKDSFLKGLVDREKNYPTGLKTSVCGIAIPHTDSIHIFNILYIRVLTIVKTFFIYSSVFCIHYLIILI